MKRWLIGMFAVVLLSSGCSSGFPLVLRSTHNDTLATLKSTTADRDGLADKVKTSEATLAQKDKELTRLTEALQEAEKEKKDLEAKVKSLTQEVETAAQLNKAIDESKAAKEKEVENLKRRTKEIQVRAEALLDRKSVV